MNSTTSISTACVSKQLNEHAARHFVDTVNEALNQGPRDVVFPYRTITVARIAQIFYKAAKKVGHSKADAETLRDIALTATECEETARESLQASLDAPFMEMTQADVCRLIGYVLAEELLENL